MRIRAVKFTPAPPDLQHTGLLGWISFTLVDSGLQVDGVALRRTLDGRRALSFPARRDSRDRGHARVRPIDDETRRQIEQEVFAALDLKPQEAP